MTARPDLVIAAEDPTAADVLALLEEHLRDMYATSPPESVHALDVEALRAPGIRFYAARDAGVLLGCGALRWHDTTHAELKSMRTTLAARGTGVGRLLLAHLLAEAAAGGADRVSLETGVEPYFEPARRLYAQHGFVECPPFGSYLPDPNSVFMTRPLVR